MGGRDCAASLRMYADVQIPLATKLARFEENIASADLQMSVADLAQIAEALSHIEVEGERYPANLMAIVGR